MVGDFNGVWILYVKPCCLCLRDSLNALTTNHSRFCSKLKARPQHTQSRPFYFFTYFAMSHFCVPQERPILCTGDLRPSYCHRLYNERTMCDIGLRSDKDIWSAVNRPQGSWINLFRQHWMDKTQLFSNISAAFQRFRHFGDFSESHIPVIRLRWLIFHATLKLIYHSLCDKVFK